MASAVITPTSAPAGGSMTSFAYVDSIGAATGLVGLYGGAYMALAAAVARPHAVTAVAAVGTTVFSLMGEQEQAALGDGVARMGELAAEGRLSRRPRPRPSPSRGRYAPNLLNVFQQLEEYEGPDVDDPAVLGAISTPVLVVYGSDSKPLWKPFFTHSARHVAEHVPNARLLEIPGAGHAAPLTNPEALAKALTEFFSPAQQPA